MPRRSGRRSMDSDSSSASSPERGMDDDNESFTEHHNDSQSSLSVSLEEMDLDNFDYEHQRRVSPISRLPAELLIAVFSRLSSPSDLLNCMLVSKPWARNSVDLLWHRPVTNRWKSLLNVIQTARKKDGFFAYHDLIKRLNLGQLKSEISDGTLQPLSVCKRIERLTLPGCNQLTDLSVVPVIDGNRSLIAIDLTDLDMITDRSMTVIAKNCYRLQGLNITNCKGVTDESLVEVAKSCRRLKRLKLNDCTQLSDFSVTAFADNCSDMLEVDLFRCGEITDISVTALIKGSRQLRELRLAQCSRITDEAFLQLPSDYRFDALRILDLTDCNEVQDAALQKIVQVAPRLRNLVLAKCRNVTDRGVMAITKLGKNLHFLHLGHCSLITDYGVQALIKYCNRIRYIDFSCCANLTDDSVSMLATLPKLKRIGLVKCANITDFSVRALARPKAFDGRNFTHNNLERLHLSYCTNLTIRGIRHLLINCPQLTHLSLTGVQPFLRQDLLAHCREAPNEFNDHQRDVFCVYSGSGVYNLRRHLQENYQTPPSSDAGSDDDASFHFHGRQLGMASSAPTSTFFGPPGNANVNVAFGHATPNVRLLQELHPGMHPVHGMAMEGVPLAPPDHHNPGQYQGLVGHGHPGQGAGFQHWTPPLYRAPQHPPPQLDTNGQPHSAPGPASFLGMQPEYDTVDGADLNEMPHATAVRSSHGPSLPPPTLQVSQTDITAYDGDTTPTRAGPSQGWHNMDDIDEPFRFEHTNSQ